MATKLLKLLKRFRAPNEWSARAQSILQPFFFLGSSNGDKPTRIASSNTDRSPFCVKAEHSIYFTAPIAFDIPKPWNETQLIYESSEASSTCMLVIGSCFFNLNSSMVLLSLRKSALVPINRIGVEGQWWRTSGNHRLLTFSNELGLTKAKQIRKTLVWGYDSGRKRS